MLFLCTEDWDRSRLQSRIEGLAEAEARPESGQ